MIIEQHTNNSVDGFRIIDEEGVYFYDVQTEQEAIDKYNIDKEREANPPEQSLEEKRKKEYFERGLTPEKLIIALWEKVVEGRSEEADKLQAERVKVKEKYPKIEN